MSHTTESTQSARSFDVARRRRAVTVYVGLFAVLAVFLVLSLTIGTVAVPVNELLGVLGGAGQDPVQVSVVWDIRIPRLIAAVFLGGALALAGYLLQTFFNNPIAGPFVLGISSGAKLVVAIMMVLVVGSGTMSSGLLVASAFTGSLIAMFFVLLISRRINSMAMLIVAGVMIGYICSAVTDFLVTFASDQNIVNLRNWSLGTFSGIRWEDVTVFVIVVSVCAVAVFLLSKPLGAFQMGEAYAKSMGVNIRLFKVVLVVLSSLLAAVVTAYAGPISFVGIAVPYLVKQLMGSSRPLVVVPGVFLGGAIFCLVCDLIARTVFAPTEVTISAVTALFGAPVVIAIMMRRRVGGGS